jgi:hypothetical protein
MSPALPLFRRFDYFLILIRITGDYLFSAQVGRSFRKSEAIAFLSDPKDYNGKKIVKPLLTL